ncbi:CHAP domain-containing protein [Nocardia sp. NBC_01503]|uniref:CHAP domain-containing protein n=1 Tax=Nocardia sp. NBC_01503 TaxID=2975997 RepID=UPI002E7ABCFB|nr:CHAP domain-containing protein [Nocardia sp. NBC_01503]WTL35784.1 CHAP domain-containing protein [Nocardia sp. NBC_01503]
MTVRLERPARKRRGPRWLALVAALTVLAVGAVVGVRWWQQHSGYPAVAGDRLRSFPAVDRTGLDATQLSVLDVTAREFARQPGGTTYSEGVREPWCADFVSWVMRESGRPLDNPNSGSWRIPGVSTLEAYYRQQNRFEEPGYRPHIGDVVMYAGGSAFSQHTNIVIDTAADSITTIGGNEFGKISIHRIAPAEVSGIVGYGRL